MEAHFFIKEANGNKVPIIVSVPHCGTAFPEELKNDYDSSLSLSPDDTDWYVQDLYNFVSDMGITMIYAKYSRWVIDLNRDPKSAPLYNDGRIITGLTPSTDFFGNEIYINEKVIPDQQEVQRRLTNYYWPYYNKIQELIDELKDEFGKVLLWDAHSIRKFVPTIRKENFPDMILGNNDEKTADKSLIETAITNLRNSNFEVTHNTPFKGGHITRYFGNPLNNVHTLQLEMVKTLYMEDDELHFSVDRANKVREVLQPTFEKLIETINIL